MLLTGMIECKPLFEDAADVALVVVTRVKRAGSYFACALCSMESKLEFRVFGVLAGSSDDVLA
jgi:hypothetical protein